MLILKIGRNVLIVSRKKIVNSRINSLILEGVLSACYLSHKILGKISDI